MTFRVLLFEQNEIFEEAENLKIKLGSWFDVSKTKIASARPERFTVRKKKF